jgi:hypothetical protein
MFGMAGGETSIVKFIDVFMWTTVGVGVHSRIMFGNDILLLSSGVPTCLVGAHLSIAVFCRFVL